MMFSYSYVIGSGNSSFVAFSLYVDETQAVIGPNLSILLYPSSSGYLISKAPPKFSAVAGSLNFAKSDELLVISQDSSPSAKPYTSSFALSLLKLALVRNSSLPSSFLWKATIG